MTDADTSRRERDPLATMDALKWAEEFVRLFGGDVDLMLSWFANAIMRGYDAAEAKSREEAAIKDAEIAALRAELQHAQGALTAESNLHAESEERDLVEIAALREIVKELEYANAMFTAENKSLREAIIGIEGGLNVADSWRNHPTVRRALEGQP